VFCSEETRAGNSLCSAWPRLAPGTRDPCRALSGPCFCWSQGWALPAPFLGLVVTAMVFLQCLKRNLSFGSAVTLQLSEAGRKERGTRAAPWRCAGGRAGACRGGERYPLQKHSFSLLPLRSSVFLQDEL